MSNTQNPLTGFYRSPKLYTRIPSLGKFYTDDIVEFPTETGELPVFAMTAKDEMLMKNPDALLNGEAVAQVISSCVPAVKKPRQMISNDVDTLLLAIQSATNGDEVDVVSKCPDCAEEVSVVASIESCLETMTVLEESYTFRTSQNLEIEVRPFSYESSVKAGVANFQSTRSLQSLANINDELEQLRAFNDNFMRIATLNFDLIVDSIASIRGKTPDGEQFLVTDRKSILEFMENCEAEIGKLVEEKISEVNKIGANKNLSMMCEKCDKTFPQVINFDPVNFFTDS
jgi:hypothetical protein